MKTVEWMKVNRERGREKLRCKSIRSFWLIKGKPFNGCAYAFGAIDAFRQSGTRIVAGVDHNGIAPPSFHGQASGWLMWCSRRILVDVAELQGGEHCVSSLQDERSERCLT